MPTGANLLAQMQNLPILPNSLAIWGLGQMGLAIKGPDAVLYFDPCLSDIVRERFGEFWVRAYPPPLMPEEVSNATYFISSHEHLDHFDTATLGPASKASPDAKLIATGWCEEGIAEIGIDRQRMIIPPALQPMTLPGTTIKLTAIPSAHYALEFDEQKGYRWLGYLIEWNGVVFYHAGDTVIYPGYLDTLRSLPTADVAIIPVNGRDWYRETAHNAVGNLLPDEAAWLAKEAGWRTVIIGHNDMYPNNTIPMGQIADAMAKGNSRQEYKILQPGELYYVVT